MYRLKKVLNLSEKVAHQELQRLAAQYGYTIYVKIRLADVLPIDNSGIGNELYRFSLQSHYDFLVCSDDDRPLFAVEFDGPRHRDPDQKGRDAKKDELCAFFDLPLLRVNSRHLEKKYNNASLLGWIVSAWELRKAFDAAQAQGAIPADEDFDPIMLWRSGSSLEEMHPHWIALRSRQHFEKLFKAGQLPVRFSCSVSFTEDDGTARGIEWIDVAHGKVVFIECAMRAQQFPLYLGDLFREIMTVSLHEKLLSFLSTGDGAVPPGTISARIEVLKQRFSIAGYFSAPTAVSFSLSLRERMTVLTTVRS